METPFMKAKQSEMCQFHIRVKSKANEHVAFVLFSSTKP